MDHNTFATDYDKELFPDGPPAIAADPLSGEERAKHVSCITEACRQAIACVEGGYQFAFGFAYGLPGVDGALGCCAVTGGNSDQRVWRFLAKEIID
jgi:hypothetical protein